MKKIILYFLISSSLQVLSKEENYYDLLEVSINASEAEIKRAYKKKAQLYHPDRNTSSHAEEMMKNINEAYNVLKDPDSRLKYDKNLSGDRKNFSKTETKSENSDVNLEDISNLNNIEEFLEKYPDPEERKQLVKDIYGLKDETNIRRVLNILLQDPDPVVRKEIAKYIHSLQSKEIIIEVLNTLEKDPDPIVRSAVATHINKLNIKSKIIEILNTLMTDPDPDVRREVVEAAVRLDNPSGERILDTLMEDPDPAVREHIPFALIEIRTSGEIIEDVVRETFGLKPPNKSSPENQKKKINRFKTLMTDPAPNVRKAVAKYVTSLKDPKVSEEILNTLTIDPDPSVSREVIEGAVRLGGSAGEELLDLLMTDPDPAVRSSIPFELTLYYSRIQTKSIIERFKILMKDPVSIVRKVTAERAGHLKDRKVSVQILNVLIRDSDPNVRRGVIKGAVRMGGSEGEQLLNRLMQEPDSEVKVSIINEMIYIYSRVSESRRVARLETLARDADSSVRKTVAAKVTHLKNPVTAEKILNDLTQDPSIQVIQQVMKSAITLGNRIAKRIIEKIFTSHPNQEVREAVFGLITGHSSTAEIPDLNSYRPGKEIILFDFDDIKARISHDMNAIKNERKQSFDTKNFQSKRKTRKTLKKDYLDPEDRKELLEKAVKIGGSVGENILEALIEDPVSTVRSQIPLELSEYYSRINKTKSLDIFTILMTDPVPDVRKTVAQHVTSLKDSKVSEEILNTLVQDSDPNVRIGVIEGAFKLGGHAGESILNIFMTDSNPDVRRIVPLELTFHSSAIDQDSTLSIFKHLMADPVPNVRENVAKNAHILEDQIQAEQILNILIKDPVPNVRRGVIEGAVKLGGHAGENLLSIATTDPVPTVRSGVPLEITCPYLNIRSSTIFNTLKILSTDLSPDVRKKVAQFVKYWEESEKAEEILNLLTKDTNLAVIKQVMESAVSMGLDIAQRIISKILNDNPNPNTRKEASEYARINRFDAPSSTKTSKDNVNNRQLHQEQSCESLMSNSQK